MGPLPAGIAALEHPMAAQISINVISKVFFILAPFYL
jgi:hypothetical protein